MGRQRFGDFLRKLDILGATDDHSLGNQMNGFERSCRDDITVEEIQDVYAAIQEIVCDEKFGFRHSHSYWAVNSAKVTLETVKRYLDDDVAEAAKLKFGKLDVYTWLAMVEAGPNSAHLDLMAKFRGDNFTKYLQACKKEELVQIFQIMKIQFRYDTNDTDLNEQSYGSLLCSELVRLFKEFGRENLMLVQTEFLDLYLHYLKQLPNLTEKMTLYVGYLVRDMVDGFEKQVPKKHRPVRNPYLDFKDVNVMTAHVQALKTMLLEFDGDIDKQRLKHALDFIVQAALIDRVVEPLFDCLVDLCLCFVKREHLPTNYDKIVQVFRSSLFRDLKDVMVPTSPMLDTCLKSVKAMVAGLEDVLEKPLLDLINEIVNKVICIYPTMSPEQVKSLLDLVVKLLSSGHQPLVKLAKDVIDKKDLQKVFLWKKYTEEVKVLMKTVGQQPVDRMWAERQHHNSSDVIHSYYRFMECLLEKLQDAKMLPKLNQDVKTYIFDCLENCPPAKADLANYATRDNIFFIKKADPPEFKDDILVRCDTLLKNETITWDSPMQHAVKNLLAHVIQSYDGNGRMVTPKQHELFMSVFMTCLAGDDMDDTFYPPGQEKKGGVKFTIYTVPLYKYIELHRQTATLSCCVGLLPDILKWAKMAEEEEHDDVKDPSLSVLRQFSFKAPPEMAKYLPQIMELFLNAANISDLYGLVSTLYNNNPDAVHSHLEALVDMYDNLKESEKSCVMQVVTSVAGVHPEVITDGQVSFLFRQCEGNTWDQQMVYLNVLNNVAKRCPQKIQPHFPSLLDNKLFHDQTLSLRVHAIGSTVGRNEKCSQQAIDYFIKLVANKDSSIALQGLGQLSYLVKDHTDYMQKYKTTLQKIESTSTVPEVRQSSINIVQVLEGKNYEDVFEDLYKELQEQQEATAELDEKLGHTMQTVITMGEHVAEHHKELIDVKRDLSDLEEKVDEIDEDLGETKLKVEEIDNKTMTNAPSWSRDLTKLMNPEQEADWRLLASRLGYSNDDIRAWSQQHDPCMALLSEWYATHKTSDANHAVLNSLVEMNRMDGVGIVENAMKASEGVVEDDDFEYPSPPPIFLSYQWGMQDEVKLLKQHLNMAGYECWMDIGQMGGGDKLFAKIDNGIRAAKVIICCVTEKYAQSPNCNREVNLSVNLGKPIIPLLMEKMSWPPKGSMGPIFSEYLFIRFFQRGGEDTKDNRYWPVPKFQELLMQLNYSVAPDESLITKEYYQWWAPIVEDIVIDKNKHKASVASSSSEQSQDSSDTSPVVFLSYQWGKQPQVKALYQRIRSLGYTVWMDIFQMGGGDSLYDKIDKGVRDCKVVVTCVTPKYALSANCRREVSLADALKKPIIPLLLEQMKWPPDGPMSMVFTELIYIQVYRDPDIQTKWVGEKFDELAMKISQYVGDVSDKSEKSATDQKKTAGQSTSSEHQTKQTSGLQKHEPNGSASSSKFVEPKTKVPNVQTNNTKPQSPASGKRQDPEQTAQKDGMINTTGQPKSTQEKTASTTSTAGNARAAPTRKTSSTGGQGNTSGPGNGTAIMNADSNAGNNQRKAPNQPSSAASTESCNNNADAIKTNKRKAPANQDTHVKSGVSNHNDTSQKTPEDQEYTGSRIETEKPAPKNVDDTRPATGKPQSKSCTIL